MQLYAKRFSGSTMNPQPNIVLITTDHQRYDCVGANGNPHIHTPHLDQLAAEGVSLEHCYVQSPICMPSRASIWSGTYPQNHGVRTNGITLPQNRRLISHVLQDNGYQTVNVGKLHFLPHYGRDHTRNDIEYAGYGYEINRLSDEPGCYPDAYIRWLEANYPNHIEGARIPQPPSKERDHFHPWVFDAPEEASHPFWIAQEVEQFLDQRTETRPFFLSAGLYAPHPPLNPVQRFLDLYAPLSDLPLPRIHETERERPLGAVAPEEWQRMKAFFYALCSQADAAIGRILASLERNGLTENTVIVFLSDHGDALGDHAMVSKGPANYESILRVPCLLRLPGTIPAGRRVSGLVEAIDLMPTMCRLADVPVPAGVKGRDILPLLTGETDEARPDTLTEWRDPETKKSVKTLRTERWKYFRYEDGREKLFDLAEPDEEVFDRAGDSAYRETLAELRNRLLQRLMEAEDDLPPRTHPY
ncbi:MAG: arylsulfatase [Armatimonadaceae bacterium]